MAGLRVELVVILTGTLLLASVQGWEWVNKTQLLQFYEGGWWGKVFTSPDDSSDNDHGFQMEADSGSKNWASITDDGFPVEFVDASRHDSIDDDNSDDKIPEDAIPEAEGAATSDNFDSLANHGFQIQAVSGQKDWASITDDRFLVEFVDAPSDDRIDYDNSEDTIPEDAIPEAEGAATSDKSDPHDDSGFQVKAHSGPRNWASWATDGFPVESVDASPRSWTSITTPNSPGLNVDCSDAGFRISLPAGSLSEVKILGSTDRAVMEAPEMCGYDVNPLQSTFTVPFTGCNVKQHTDSYSLELLYIDELGQTQVATASCDQSQKFDSDLLPHASDQTKSSKCSKNICPESTTSPPTTEPSSCSSKCSTPTTSPSTCSTKCSKPTICPVSKAQNCAVPAEEQVACGQSGISSSDCEEMGCCMNSCQSACYYPLDTCTGDQHFVFAIRHDSASFTSIPVDPTKLVIPGHTNCKPVIVNDEVAIYKFKVTECGARAYEIGETTIYLAEVHTVVQALNLKYGVITRSDPLRFMVECRYNKEGIAQQPLASVGYMVKIPPSNLPSAVSSSGLYGVRLRIATDETYSNYFPTYHQPLWLLLGKPVYLELYLDSPKQDAVILVNYCLAYPRSARNALVLIYEGCANPNDPKVSILVVSDLPKNRHQRRFVVRAFQFMDQRTNKYLDEEIYFMCSAEVCRPGEQTCEERCFDGKAQ